MTLTLAAGQIITGSVSMVAASASYQTTRKSGATDLAPPTYPVMNATSNIARLGFAGSVISDYVMQATIDIDNSITQSMAVGTLYAVGLVNGDLNVTGTLNAYFEDITLIQDLLNNSATSLNFVIADPLNPQEAYILDLPQAKLTSAQVNDVAKNRAVMQSIGFRAVLSPTYGYTAKLIRFWSHQ